MALKLVIGNFLDVPVKGALQGEAGPVPFSFRLRAKRIDIAAYRKLVAPESGVLLRDFLADSITGWTGQRLVLDDQDKPADFSPEALDLMLSVVGMEHTIFQAYDKALTVSATPKGAAGN